MVDKLAESSIIPIFAVRRDRLHLYQNATDQLFRGGIAEVLEENSANILKLIETAYNRITQKQHLMLKTSDALQKEAFCLGTEAEFTDSNGVFHTFNHGEDITGLNSNSVVKYSLVESVHQDATCGDESDTQIRPAFEISRLPLVKNRG